jgi:hypothetical protein
MEYRTFEMGMMRLYSAWSRDPVPAQIAVYWERLSTNSDETFAEAVKRVIDSERNFPVIATLHGYCDRVREEAATRQASESGSVPRLRPGERLPVCATCLDSGWVNVPSSMPNLPGTLTKCPDCGMATKGRDPIFQSRQRDAYAYMLDHEHAHYPAFKAGENATDPAMSAADLADRLRMDRRR